ncbi:hypothetical protein ABT247_05120 [Kitasatospora sp. NPDC001539]|uniref:hypothetical protein n=1 Tax=Kitasatospora sp. NPDC001539 TaxID=3154384 RepID=UPI0033235D3B
MNITCPTCASADETVAVRKALLDSDRPLDPPTRELLSMPPEPGGTTGAAITLFVLAALFGLLGLGTLFRGDAGSSSTAYQVGYHYGALLAAAILLALGFIAHSYHRSRRRNDTATQWPRTYDQWQRLHETWRATWLCRRCRVAFLPAAPSAVPVAQFPQWAAAVARQDDGPGAAPAASD